MNSVNDDTRAAHSPTSCILSRSRSRSPETGGRSRNRSGTSSSSTYKPKAGGRSRPAVLALMFAPVDSSANDAAQCLDPVARPLSLLLLDPATRDYVCPELHDLRVRCVLDAPESRGLVYRAHRMRRMLDQHLAADQTRYIDVFRRRMLALQQTGSFNPDDMQVIRGHMLSLERRFSANSLFQSTEESRSGSVARKNVADALLALKMRFDLPAAFLDCPEMHRLLSTLHVAQAQGAMPQPLDMSRDTYRLALDRARVALVKRTAARIIQNARSLRLRMLPVSLLLHAQPVLNGRLLVRMAVSAQRQTHHIALLLVDTKESEDAQAQRVCDVFAQFQRNLKDEGEETDEFECSRVVSVVVGGSWSTSEDFCHSVGAKLQSLWSEQCVSKSVECLAQSLLDATVFSNSAQGCSSALIDVSKAIAHNPAAHALWIATMKDAIALPIENSPLTISSHLKMIHQLLAADHDVLLGIRPLIAQNDNTVQQSLDHLLDRRNAPTLIALAQILELLDTVYTFCQKDNGLFLSDLALVLARLEATLRTLSTSGSGQMQSMARTTLAIFRQRFSEEFLARLVLAHALSMHSSVTVQSPLRAPLSIANLISLARDLIARLDDHNIHRDDEMPTLYTHWENYTQALCASHKLHAADLPAAFPFRRLLDLVGIADDDPRYTPFAGLATMLCDCPTSALLSVDQIDLTSDDPDRLAELEIRYAQNTEQHLLDTQPSAMGMAEHQNQLLNFGISLQSANVDLVPLALSNDFQVPPTVESSIEEPSLLLCYFAANKLPSLITH